jgi:hypothetical protein
MRLLIAIPSLLVGCYSVAPVCPEPSPAAELDAGHVVETSDAGRAEPVVLPGCWPDIYEPDDEEPYWGAMTEGRLSLTFPGTWHTDGPDRFKVSYPREVVTQPDRVFSVHVEGAGEVRATITCVTGHWITCSGEVWQHQQCRASTDGEDLEITGSCSFGAAVIELDAYPRAAANCERIIHVELR